MCNVFGEGKWEELAKLWQSDSFWFELGGVMKFLSFYNLNDDWRACANMRIWIFLLLILLLKNDVVYCGSDYLIGVGSYDITGPAADVNMMGYGNTEQSTSGIHFRLRARTFIVAERKGNRVVFVNLDACMAPQIVTIKVIERLKARYQH